MDNETARKMLAAPSSITSSRETEEQPAQMYNERPTWLDNAHRALDRAVFAAYGWPYPLPNQEILARLLALNHQRATAQAEPTSRSAHPTRSKAQNGTNRGNERTDYRTSQLQKPVKNTSKLARQALPHATPTKQEL